MRRLLGVLAALLCVPATAFADFDNPASNNPDQQFTSSNNPQRDDTPNDPGYDPAERGVTTNPYAQRFDLFGFPSKYWEATALYKDPSDLTRFGKPMVAGFNAAGAWKLSRGRPDVKVSVLDTGIRWDDEGLRTQIALNSGELHNHPDTNGNGHLDVDDFIAETGKAKPTGEDVIKAMSDGVDDDHNGYVDDIAGWDFFDDDNDPADTSSYFAAAGHGTGRAKEVAESGNDGQGEIGVCPKCQVMPLRVWDTFVSDQTTFGLAILYATDNGVSVIEGADGGLYHSAFTEKASDYAYTHGVAQVFSGDDLNTGNHNYPANYSHTMLIEGAVGDTYGLGEDFGDEANQFLSALPIPLGSSVPTTTLFRGAGTTQYGGHSSVSMIGATGSENTGKAAGAVALVYAAAKDAGVTLSADEAREIVEQTAEDVTAPNTVGAGNADRAVPGWDPHFGWGRVNLGAAVKLAKNGPVPPEAAIWSPDWYAPVTGSDVPVTGRARVRSGSYHWKLEWGAGETPASWTTAHEGDGTAETTDFGTLDMDAIRAAVTAASVPTDPGEPTFSALSPNPYQREFSVRLTVTSGGATGVDRRVFNALDDDTIKPTFPKRMGAGGEAPIRYADLDGDNKEELVVPLEDGTVHAYDGDHELPGFPVHTDLMKQATGHDDSDALSDVSTLAPPREPPRAVTIADLDDDGSPELITTAGRHVYVWETDGTRRAGFPAGIDPANCDPADEVFKTHHWKCGFLASPAVAHLEGADGPADIVAPALDGRVYAFRPDGSSVPHFPVTLLDPAVAPADQMHAESINEPAIGDLDGDGADDVVIASNESYPGENTVNTDILSQVLAQAGGTSRLYAISGKTGAFLPGWPVHLSGAIQDTLPLIGPGHDAAIATLGGAKRIVATTTGSTGIDLIAPDGSIASTLQQSARGAGSDVTDAGGLNLFESAVVGDVLGTGTAAVVKYAVTLGQVVNLLLVGQNVPYSHTIQAYDGTTGLPLPAWPRVTDDYQFLSSSTVAKVDPTSTANQVLAGTGLGLLHAYDGLTGLDAPGFPKATGGWLFSPAALSDDGRIAGITREGYLYQWSSNAPACQPAGVWPAFRHDDHGSGNADTDGTAPGSPQDAALVPAAGDQWTLTFTSPGDDRMCGTPAAYTGRAGGADVDLGDAVEAAGEQVSLTVTLPGDTGTLVLGATDEAGNRGIAVRVPYERELTAPADTPTPTPSPAPATVTPTPTATPGKCRDQVAPVAKVMRVKATRRRLVASGTARDRGCAGLRRVSITVKRLHSAGGPCFVGRITDCLGRRYEKAHGLKTWKVTLRGRLPRGRYVVAVRARDRYNNRGAVGLKRFRIRVKAPS